MKYDYLIIGAGLYGSVFAYEATKRNKRCLVVDKRNHIGGNVYTKKTEGINVHKYGSHIFHTSNKYIWEYVNNFISFNRYIHTPLVKYKNKTYNLPFNMNTFNQLWGVKTPEEARLKIVEETKKYMSISPNNLEQQALKLLGDEIYEKIIKGYSQKQWGKECNKLPSFLIKRIPIRFEYDNNYYDDTYQGIPAGGYTQLIEALLKNIDVKLNSKFTSSDPYFKSLANKIIYTGMIDEYFQYKLGVLEYRSLEFEEEKHNIKYYQKSAVINYAEEQIPYTRIIEHKYFEFNNQSHTIITKEYPRTWHKTLEAYYPINDKKNNELYEKYKQLGNAEHNVLFAGRLGSYKYYNMDEIINICLNNIKKEFCE